MKKRMGTIKHNKYRLSVIVLIVSLFLFLPSISAQTSRLKDYAEQIRIIERYIKANMEIFQIPGLAIGFYKDDFTWTKGFGYADLEHKVPVKPHTLFRMASITKPMTAVAIMKLAQDGKLNLDDDVQKYVPYFPRKKWPITIRHLLGHLSGISHYRKEEIELHLKTYHNTRQAIDIFKDWELEAEPGTKFIYTSYGYNLLGAVIEGASGQSYSQYMTENIWKPLGMSETRMDIADDIIPNRTRGYRYMDGKIKNCEFIDISSRFAGGGTLSTVIDLLKFSRGLDKGKVIPLEAQKKMYTSMTTKDKRYTEYGMGWAKDYLSGFWNISHSGGQAGTSTYILRFPDENAAAAVAINLQDHKAQKFATLVQRIILGAFHVKAETPSEDEFLKFHFVWHMGLGYFSQHNQPFTDNANELAESFKYFNRIDARNKDAQKKIIDGIHETTGSPLFKIGTYMAHALAKKYGKEKLNYYRKMGAIPFFVAYINLYKKDPSIPVEYHFTKKLERLTTRWNHSWEKTWTDETKSFFLLPLTDIEKVKEQLKKIFKGKTVYPRLDFIPYTRELRDVGKLEKGLDLLKIAAELYPKNVDLYYTMGEYHMEKGDNHAALETFKRALPLDKNKANAARYLSWAKDAIQVVEKPVVLPAETLNKFVGDYGLRHITYQKGNLYYKREGSKIYRLIPLSKDTFALDGRAGFRIRFDVDKDGQVTQIIGLYIDGKQEKFPRDPQQPTQSPEKLSRQ